MGMFTTDVHESSSGVKLYRCKAGTQLHLVALCTGAAFCRVHWVGQSVLCGGSGCELCDFNVARQKVFIAVGRPLDAGLLELSVSAFRRLEEQLRLSVVPIEHADFVITLKARRECPSVQVLGTWHGDRGVIHSVDVVQSWVCLLHGIRARPDDFIQGTPSDDVVARCLNRAKAFAGFPAKQEVPEVAATYARRS